MSTRYLVAGDRGAYDDFELSGVADLVGYETIVGHVWQATRDRDAHTVTVTVLDAEARMCRVQWGAALDGWLPSQTGQGAWLFEVEAAWPDQPAITWPSSEPVHIKVRAQGDPS